MDARIFPLLLLVATVSCKDLMKGQDVGVNIFDEKKEASPAIWRQANNFTISANDSDVISKVVVTDLRADKDGEARIVEGGPGNKNVTIEVKSPTALRGYEYQIQVFAVSIEEITPELIFDDKNDTESSNITPSKDQNSDPAFDDLMTRLNGTGNINIPQNPDMVHPGVISKDRTVRSSETPSETTANTEDSTTSTTTSPGNLKNNQGVLNEATSTTITADQSTIVPPTILNKDQKRFERDVKPQLQENDNINTNQDSSSITEGAKVNTDSLKTTPRLSTPKPNTIPAIPPIVLTKDIKTNDQRVVRDISTKKPDTEIPFELNNGKENKTSELDSDNLDHTLDNRGFVNKTITGVSTDNPSKPVTPVNPLTIWPTDSKVDPNIKFDASSTVKPVISIKQKS